MPSWLTDGGGYSARITIPAPWHRRFGHRKICTLSTISVSTRQNGNGPASWAKLTEYTKVP